LTSLGGRYLGGNSANSQPSTKPHTLSLLDGFFFCSSNYNRLTTVGYECFFLYDIFSDAFAVSLVCYKELA